MEETKISYIGADLGGTKLLLGEMDEDGRLLRTRRCDSGVLTQREALALIERELDAFLAESTPGYTPAAIGIGLVGRVDYETGIWHEISPALAEEIPMGELISRRYGLPCFLDNDVRSATRAEMRFGMGRESKDFIYINIGTGIAAGFVSGGRLISGSHSSAGEVGHTASGIALHVPCPCGREDCVEMVASGLGLDASARLLRPRFPGTKLPFPEHGRVRAEDIFGLHREDALCETLVENAASGVANLIMNLVRFNDPDTVVLGGGAVYDGVLYPRVLGKLQPEAIRFVTKGIVLTRLDPRYIGILGACCNALFGMEGLSLGSQ